MAMKGGLIMSSNPDLIELRKDEGVKDILLGVMGMLVGVGCMAFGVHGLIVGGSPDAAPPIIPLLFGIPFLALGARFALYRRWVIFDSQRKVVVKRSGFLVPMWQEEIPFDGIARIQLRLIAAQSEGAMPSRDVDLLFKDGNRLCAYHGPDRAVSIEVATKLAMHTGIAVEDLSDHVV